MHCQSFLRSGTKQGAQLKKIKHCIQMNETIFMHRICIKLLSCTLMQHPNFYLFVTKLDFYLGPCNVISTLSLTAFKMFLTFENTFSC